jgi:GNAT superfamily N-acetyltransferase
MKIRPAKIATDLPRIVEITNPYETNPLTVDQMRSFFEYNPPGRIQKRLVAVDEKDEVIGYSGAIHEASTPAGRFIIWVIVDPSRRGRKIGSALWEALLEFLKEQGANHLETDVLEREPAGLVFAGRRGFTVDRHSFHSSLDLAAFDEVPYLPGITSLQAEGIRFCSLADFPDTPETRRQLYDLNYQYEPEILSVIPGQAEFEQFVFGASWFQREGQLLAVDGDVWAGLAAIQLKPESRSAYNENTVVAPAYRGRKIARALKVLASRYARQHGARTLETDNNSINTPILAINRRMGYRPQPGKYWLVRRLEN